MDGEQFDTLARALGGRRSRRAALRGGSAGIAMSLFAALGLQRAAPRRERRRSAPTPRDPASAAIAPPGRRTPVATRRSSAARTTRTILPADQAPARRPRSAATPRVRHRRLALTAAAAATAACRVAVATGSRAAQTTPSSPEDLATACGKTSATSRDAPARGARVTVGRTAPVTLA